MVSGHYSVRPLQCQATMMSGHHRLAVVWCLASSQWPGGISQAWVRQWQPPLSPAHCPAHCPAYYPAYCTLHAAHCTLHCTLNYVHSTAYCLMKTSHCTLKTQHCTRKTPHCTLKIVPWKHNIIHIAYWTLITILTAHSLFSIDPALRPGRFTVLKCVSVCVRVCPLPIYFF